MFALEIFRGPPPKFGVCASKRGSVSSACKKRGQHPLRAEFWYAEEGPLGWVNMSAY